jgi:hypothetical protein
MARSGHQLGFKGPVVTSNICLASGVSGSPAWNKTNSFKRERLPDESDQTLFH